MKCGILLLAAGWGRRFGADKRQARLSNGRTLLQQTVAQLRCTGLPLRVCLRPGDDPLYDGFEAAEVLVCPGAQQGMGVSLAEGVAQVPGDWDAVLVALADMPCIRPATVQAVTAALQPEGIVVPVYRGQRGHPVALHRHWFAALRALRGDRGARAILEAAGDACRWLPVVDPGVVQDVDRREDLAALFS